MSITDDSKLYKNCLKVVGENITYVSKYKFRLKMWDIGKNMRFGIDHACKKKTNAVSIVKCQK